MTCCIDCEADLDVDIDDQHPPRPIYTDRSGRPDPDLCPETGRGHLPRDASGKQSSDSSPAGEPRG